MITSPEGSYREPDVMKFLDKHLPEFGLGRRWRIMMADDYGPHKSPKVFRLWWQRGYVMVVHGGGNTPVAQTCDTDLNQHVTREYLAREMQELMQQFRNSAVAAPKVRRMLLPSI